MLKLYGGPSSRASVPRWYLEELGLPYELVFVNLGAGEHHTPKYRAINPIGKVPALDDDGTKVWESGAILLYLAGKHDKMANTPEGRAELYSWVVYANATLVPAITTQVSRAAHVMRVVQPLEGLLSGREFLVGERLTVADVAVGAMLIWANLAFRVDLSSCPTVMAYIGRLLKRPAAQLTLIPAL